MDELWQLTQTAGAEPVCTVLQTRDKPDPHSFLGMGKVQELKELIENESCDLAIFDNDLTPSQARVLEETPKLTAAYRALAAELADISEE